MSTRGSAPLRRLRVAANHHRTWARSSNLDHPLIKLKRPRSVQEIDDAAFVWLHPVQLNRLERAEIEPVDVDAIGRGALELGVVGDRRANERRSDVCALLLLPAFPHGADGYRVFSLV